MPRYFFHLRDGALFVDHEGEILPDEATARVRAETLAYELAGEYGPAAIIVTLDDAGGRPLLIVPIAGEQRLH
jgi:hypothetical protein